MTELLPNYVAGRWQGGSGAGTPLFDPVLGTELVRVDATGLDLPAAFAFAREQGGAALRTLAYRQRAGLLGAIVKVLQANRDAYYEIATANSGTVKNDSAVDIDGAIFTLSQYAKWGDALGDVHALRDGEAVKLGKEPVFQSQHLQLPTHGVALFINAFNFPSWGLWEKAAPALLSGVPVIVKPATATAWLTQRMVKDVVDAGVLPDRKSVGLLRRVLVLELREVERDGLGQAVFAAAAAGVDVADDDVFHRELDVLERRGPGLADHQRALLDVLAVAAIEQQQVRGGVDILGD